MHRSLLATLALAATLAACTSEDAPFAPEPGEEAGATPGAGGATPGAGGGAQPEGGADASGGAGGAGTGAGAPGCGLPGASGDLERTLSVSGDERRYLLHVPASYDGSAARPLVVALHGFTETPETMREVTHLDELADERDLLVAYPAGLGGSWNGGTCCGSAMFTGVDDVAFIAALIDDVSATFCVDPARVFVTGFSNGGFMAHRLGCELADRVAAIGVVAGQESLSACAPAKPVAVLQIHGDADPVVPFGGNPLLGFPPTSDTIAGWRQRDTCADASSPTWTLGDTYCEAFGPCAGDTAVELCTVAGGGHDWPGGGTAWTDPPQGFVATRKIVDFFEAHPRQ